MPENPDYWTQIELEYRRLRRDHQDQHNKAMHRYLLEKWERESPRMWASLSQVPGRAKALAWVLQHRMWTRQEELMRGGLPVTDAREQAERENLLLEPEADEIPETPETLLPTKVVQQLTSKTPTP